jgi:hypothetical protein
MRMITRSRKIRSAVRTTLRRIPVADREVVSRFVALIRTRPDYFVEPLSGALTHSSARMLPLWKGPGAMGRDVPRAQIEFCLPVCRRFSDRALLAVAAHEFGHALRAARFGPGWEIKLNGFVPAEERACNRQVCAWGFGSHLQQKDREWKKVVGPYLDRHEERIFRNTKQRWEAQGASARAKLAALKITGIEGC